MIEPTVPDKESNQLEKFKYALLVKINELNYLALREHYQCEDEYYSCPYHTTGQCRCEVIEHNMKVGDIRDTIDAIMREL